MTLASGTKLGPYEVLSPLGAGGMGEVYRARDTKLNRDVAIKVLPASLAQDREALGRFEREAHSIAALNHPNILSIFDFGNEDGVSYVVMELLEGETLRSKIDGGPVPQRRAVEIATSIARGLAAAHEKEIIHRDLKPENVFLTSDGRVKILDFGLAKKLDRGAAETNAPTAPAGTEPGTVMGTIGYMSPEQVRGRELDPRTDIFSFGAILYEMLSGKRAFKRDSGIETMNAILKEEPTELVETGRSISPALDRIVRHCLEKSPEARFHSAGDIAFNLETLAAESTSSASGRTFLSPRIGWQKPAITFATIAAAVAAGILLGRATRPAASPPSFERLTSRRGTVTAARFAADGRTVIYSAQWEGKPAEVFSVPSGGQEARPLGFGEAMLLSVSSTDELALKLRPRLWSGEFHGTLARVPLSGGSPRELVENVLDADWSPDGSALALIRLVAGIKFAIEFPEGKMLREERGFLRAIRVSPDGARIAVAGGLPPWSSPSLFLLDRSGTKRVLGPDDVTGLAWIRNGKEVWFTSAEPAGETNLWAAGLGGRRRLVFRGAGLMSLEDISRSGDLIVSLIRQQASVMYHAAGAARDGDLAWHEGSQALDISPDGRTVLLSDGRPGAGTGGGPGDVFFLRKTDGSPAIRLGDGIATQFSGDGKWVFAQETGSKTTFLLVPTGPGESKKIPVPTEISQGYLFPDGRRVLVSGILPNGQARIYSTDLDGKNYRQIAPDGFDFYIGELPISPDGKFVAANNGGIGTATLQVFPAEGGPARNVPGFEEGDVVIRWADDGRSLFVFKRNEMPTHVFRLDTLTGQRTPWLELMPADPAGVTRIPSIVMSADGRSYAYNFTRSLSDLYLIRGLK
ncbi:MAG: protein kinase domain-containing protein [Thermoanaerobaculia bacterium]